MKKYRNITSINDLKTICAEALTYKSFDVDKSKFRDYEVANPCGVLARDFPQDDFRYITNIKNGNIIRTKI